jgi:hypothetical protein
VPLVVSAGNLKLTTFQEQRHAKKNNLIPVHQNPYVCTEKNPKMANGFTEPDIHE